MPSRGRNCYLLLKLKVISRSPLWLGSNIAPFHPGGPSLIPDIMLIYALFLIIIVISSIILSLILYIQGVTKYVWSSGELIEDLKTSKKVNVNIWYIFLSFQVTGIICGVHNTDHFTIQVVHYPLDFYLWGHLKAILYSTPIHNVEIRQRIEQGCQHIRKTPGIWERVRQSMMWRSEACITAHGSHFQHLL